MKGKKKLKIDELKVNSFVTSMEKISGGALPSNVPTDCIYFKTQPKTCAESINWCWTP